MVLYTGMKGCNLMQHEYQAYMTPEVDASLGGVTYEYTAAIVAH